MTRCISKEIESGREQTKQFEESERIQNLEIYFKNDTLYCNDAHFNNEY